MGRLRIFVSCSKKEPRYPKQSNTKVIEDIIASDDINKNDTSKVSTEGIESKLGNTQGNMQCFGTSCYDGINIYYGTISGIYKIDSSGVKTEVQSVDGLCRDLCNVGNKIIYIKEIFSDIDNHEYYLCMLDKTTEESKVVLDLSNNSNVYILNTIDNKIYYNAVNDEQISTYVYNIKTGKQKYFLSNGMLMNEKGIYYYIKNKTDNNIVYRLFKDNSDRKIVQIDAIPLIQVDNYLLLKRDNFGTIYKLDLKTKEYITIIDETDINFVINDGNDLILSAPFCISRCDINGENAHELVRVGEKEGMLLIPNILNGKIAYSSFPAIDLVIIDDALQEVTDSQNNNATLGMDMKNNKIDIGYSHVVVIKNNGTVWTWGGNYCNQLGNGSTQDSDIPIQVEGMNDVVSVSAGCEMTVALRKDGTVWIWGGTLPSELGEDEITNTCSQTPVQVTELADIISVSAGDNHILALKKDGTVWAWGSNGTGQLGNGSYNDSNKPVQVNDLIDVVEVIAGERDSYAIKKDGTVWNWGSDIIYQEGTGQIDSSIPVQVKELTNVVKLKSDTGHVVVLKKDGRVCSYDNKRPNDLVVESIDNGISFDRVEEVTGIAVNRYSGLLLKVDGSVWEWQHEYCKTYGNSTEILLAVNLGQFEFTTNAIEIASGPQNTVVLDEDGTIWIWGNNDNGNLGDGTFTDSVTPTKALINLND